MFNNPPNILAHTKVLEQGNYVLPDYILNKNDDEVNLFHRFCPHRMYPMHTPGEHIENIYCKFHGFEWTKDGTPINNDKKISCGKPNVGSSGLIFKNFQEPDHSWVKDIANETNLVYSHSYQGESTASWLWLMDAEADLLHLYDNGIHPFLSKQVKLEDIEMDQGDGWILQTHPHGWWLYVFPFSFVEYGKNGSVMINRVIPNDINSEYGFTWITQFYYRPEVTANERLIFETAEGVFREDVDTVKLQGVDYFPLMKAMNKYEDHCVHWGEWYTKNKIKK